MQASGGCPTQALPEGLPPFLLSCSPFFCGEVGSGTDDSQLTDKALPRVTTHPQMWAALQFQDSPCFFLRSLGATLPQHPFSDPGWSQSHSWTATDSIAIAGVWSAATSTEGTWRNVNKTSLCEWLWRAEGAVTGCTHSAHHTQTPCWPEE